MYGRGPRRPRCVRAPVRHSVSGNTGRYRRHWDPAEEHEFLSDWQDDALSDKSLSRKYGRPFKALAKRAKEAGLQERVYYQDGFTAGYICSHLGIDRQTLITVWIKHWGLKASQSKSGRRQYLVKEKDLLAFLKAHPSFYDASKIADDTFLSEPEWLKVKRKQDRATFPARDKLDWMQDDSKLERLFFRGLSDAEIAAELRRSENAVKERRALLHLDRHRWNKKELEFLSANCRHMTVDELAARLPLRNARGIALKCGKLGLPYHWSEACVEPKE